MTEAKESRRIQRIIRHPKRKLVWSVLLLIWGFLLIGRTEVTSSQILINENSLAGLAVVLAGFFVLIGHFRDRQFLKSQQPGVVDSIRGQIASESAQKTRGVSPKKALKKQLKSGNEVWGKALIRRPFGWGSITIYSNGYVYSSTRMKQPEKLVSISGNTSLMTANPYAEDVTGGVMLSIQTDKQVFSINRTTNAKSLIMTPSYVADLQEIVMVGNSVIQK